MAISGARLSIEIDIGTECRIVAEDDQGNTVPAHSELSQVRLQEMKDALRDDLEEFRTKLATVTQWRIGNAGEALLKLQKRGRLILNELFQGQTAELGKIMQMCRDACPTWSRPDWKEDGLRPPIVVVRAKLALGLPIEMLPLFEWETVGRINNKDDLARLAGSFLGFSAIVKRDIRVPIPPTLLLNNNPTGTAESETKPRLPMKMFSFRMAGARQEQRFFSGHTNIDFGQTWPSTDAPAEGDGFAQALAEQLWHPERGIAGALRNPPDQIFHFSCHCDTRAERSGQHTLTLNTGGFMSGILGRGNRKVDLESLTDRLTLLRHRDQQNPRTRPLIFLSACGSAHLDPAGASSFPEMFLKNEFGFLGFIGTEATIPDHFASVFSAAFYGYLLEGAEIGQAIHLARWKLLNEHRNPLGILYSLYAEPEIRLDRRPSPNQPVGLASQTPARTPRTV